MQKVKVKSWVELSWKSEVKGQGHKGHNPT